MKKYYTYAYLREDGTPYYIGKGSGKRAYVKSGRVIHTPPEDRILILKNNLLEEEAFRHEKYMIGVYKLKTEGGLLHNKTYGGEGPSGVIVPWKGKKRGKYKPRTCVCSEETRQKRREAAIRNNFAARLQTPEAREKMAKTRKGIQNKRDASGRFA